MIYLFFITFVIHIIVDYVYINEILDEYILLKTSGSKLTSLSRASPFIDKIREYKDKISLKEIIIYLSSILILFLFNKVFYMKMLNLNFIPINFFGKIIDMVGIFGNKIIYVIKIYDATYILFLINICGKLERHIFAKVKTSEKIQYNEKQAFLKLGKENSNTINIEENSMYQNILITGSIGSGKTTGAICNICETLIGNNMGGIILDIKGNFVDNVDNIAKKHNREGDIKVISMTSCYTLKLLPENLNNVEIAAMLKQVICLISPSNTSDSYWLDKVQNILLNILIIIEYYKKKDILEIHRMITDNEYMCEKIKYCKERLLKNIESEKTTYEMQNAIMFVEKEYINLDSRVQSILKSEITRFTIPLVTEYEIYRKFVEDREDLEYINLEDDKQIIVLSIDISKNKMIAKIIATILKINFQRYILENIGKSEKRFLIADEYQEFVNSEDANFLSLSREARCMNIISTQSYSSIKNTLKDENAANVIIQNLVNKIWFRNDDNYTVQEIIKQLGKTDRSKNTEQISESAVESKKYFFRKGFKNKKSNISKSISKVITKENEYDENFFTRELKNFEALCFISEGSGKIKVQKVQMERWKKHE